VTLDHSDRPAIDGLRGFDDGSAGHPGGRGSNHARRTGYDLFANASAYAPQKLGVLATGFIAVVALVSIKFLIRNLISSA
jgi:hypothetical protein